MNFSETTSRIPLEARSSFLDASVKENQEDTKVFPFANLVKAERRIVNSFRSLITIFNVSLSVDVMSPSVKTIFE